MNVFEEKFIPSRQYYDVDSDEEDLVDLAEMPAGDIALLTRQQMTPVVEGDVDLLIIAASVESRYFIDAIVKTNTSSNEGEEEKMVIDNKLCTGWLIDDLEGKRCVFISVKQTKEEGNKGSEGSVRIPPEQSVDFVDYMYALVGNNSNSDMTTVVLDTIHNHEFKDDKPNSSDSDPRLFFLQTRHAKAVQHQQTHAPPLVPPLPTPNFLCGVSAAILTHCECLNKSAFCFSLVCASHYTDGNVLKQYEQMWERIGIKSLSPKPASFYLTQLPHKADTHLYM
eukprot:Nk52_evm13s217 gene=Nk52_evmTU13s217